ncbi:uncharacterized protein Tco025E_00473 [Trypanosoma conorhini]|uniref:Mucin-associated surface protein (MASP) n=1 Tax=Trypanosoma conorhini TaxID=83891 RepID=A0A3R7M652_9TRYP|nr:uncharacterized protein Tco025E_00473 [Trypanosoma conorhini]RNF27282.1 hypothetical protein Tco025E_00473 [Trypanosoma conorhini]
MKVTQIVLLSALLAIVLAGGCAGVANAQSLDLPAEDEKEKGVLAADGKESAPAPPPKPHGNSSSKHHGNSSSKHHGNSSSKHHGNSSSKHHGNSSSKHHGNSSSKHHGNSSSKHHGSSSSKHHPDGT